MPALYSSRKHFYYRHVKGLLLLTSPGTVIISSPEEAALQIVYTVQGQPGFYPLSFHLLSCFLVSPGLSLGLQIPVILFSELPLDGNFMSLLCVSDAPQVRLGLGLGVILELCCRVRLLCRRSFKCTLLLPNPLIIYGLLFQVIARSSWFSFCLQF